MFGVRYANNAVLKVFVDLHACHARVPEQRWNVDIWSKVTCDRKYWKQNLSKVDRLWNRFKYEFA